MYLQDYINFQHLVGKKITSALEGQIDGWDEAIIIETESNNGISQKWLIESGSGDSRGVLALHEIANIPKNFKSI